MGYVYIFFNDILYIFIYESISMKSSYPPPRLGATAFINLRRQAFLSTSPTSPPWTHPAPGHLPDLLKPHQNPSKTSCNLPRPLWSRHRASWSRPKLSGLSSRGPSGARTLARAETGRPQNWSPASSGSTIITKSSQNLFESY